MTSLPFSSRSTFVFLPLAAAAIAVVAGLAYSNNARAEIPVANPDSAAVVAAVHSYHDALSTGDSARALTILANDAIILESGGIESRSEYRAHHLSSDIAFAKAVKSVRSPLKVIVAGNAAWTAGTSTTVGQFNGRAINSVGAESMVLTKTRNGWKIRSIHWSSRNRRAAS
ncbi:MAG: nuclear transport factor 2 family protein [Gemmatimonadota bacterium]|nr:nuclear transport factor 2 family protein [Gemmatimonadota bacterium]